MNYKEIIDLKSKAIDLYEKQDFQGTIEVIDNVLKVNPYFLPFMILKAHSIQLLDEGYEKYGGLEGAKKLLEEAVQLDKTSVYAKLELAHFLYAIDNDPKNAILEAKEALELCQNFLDECIELIKVCENEINETSGLPPIN